MYYSYAYKHEVEHASTSIDQIVKTISRTASIALYVEDKDLATEVINGLALNDTITAAAIADKSEYLAQGENFNITNAQTYPLTNPFFTDEVLGYVHIVPNTQIIINQANQIAVGNAKALALHTLVVVIIFIFVAYYLITNPLGKLSQMMQHIIPGHDNRVAPPKGHKHSEIGSVSDSINAFLDKTQSLFEQERKLRTELEVLGKRLRLLFENAGTASLLARLDGEIILYNSAVTKLLNKLGFEMEDNFTRFIKDVFQDPATLLALSQTAIKENEVVQGEFQLNNHCSDDEIWIQILIMTTVNDEGETFLQVFANDISSRKAELKCLKQKANFDKLTGLFNRQGAIPAIEEQVKHNKTVAVLLLDLDGFKPINDIHGHDAGDKMLQHISEKISSSIRKDDIAARWGGDEFVVTIHDIDKHAARVIAEKLIGNISTPLYLTAQQCNVTVGASIGVAFYPEDGDSVEKLIEHADEAMYEVKRAGKNDVSFYRKSVTHH